METKKLELSLDVAQRIYKTADAELKTILEANFGLKSLSPKLEDRIFSYEDACNELGINPLTESHFLFLPSSQAKRAFFNHQLETIIEVFNEGWKPNWNNTSEYKYYNYIYKSNGVWLVSCCTCAYSSDQGSELYIKSRELATLIGTRFKDIYIEVLG